MESNTNADFDIIDIHFKEKKRKKVNPAQKHPSKYRILCSTDKKLHVWNYIKAE